MNPFNSTWGGGMRMGGRVVGALTRLGRKFALAGLRRGTGPEGKIWGRGSLVCGVELAASWRRRGVGRIGDGLGIKTARGG